MTALSVVIASHARVERLATLLDALAGQTVDAFEVVVVHTYEPEVAQRLFDGHALGDRLRPISVDTAVARPSLQRNRGWRAAHGKVIAFTDDDCRPESDWVERLVECSRLYPGAIVQGATKPDGREIDGLGAPHYHTLAVFDPPGRWTQTCNILYERDLLERLGGFDECAVTGEDMDLALRAQEAGVAVVGARDAVVYHAVHVMSLRAQIRFQRKWQHLAYVVKRHPQLRDVCMFGVWWKREHLAAVLALAALAGAPIRPWMLAGALPYVQIERWRHGDMWWHQRRSLRELPGHWIVELFEAAAFVRGSVRYRTLLL